MNAPLTYGDLPAPVPDRELPGGGRVLSRQPILYCPACCGEYSANPGDYWNMPAAAVIECGECEEPMILAHRRTLIVEHDKLERYEALVAALQDDESGTPTSAPDDDPHERAAARARSDDFAETGGKDWT